MALYRLEVQPIKRADGRSVVAAAAYRSASRLDDARLEMTFDYTARGGVELSSVMAPDQTPARLLDRSTLWNEAEAADIRSDSRPAREILLALPHELDAKQRETLVREFIAEHVVSLGMIADFSLHGPDAHGDQRNHHAHILVTTRAVGPSGFGRKVVDWTRPQLIRDWREGWERVQNLALQRHLGPDAPQVTARSLAQQGIDRDPTIHLGPAASAMERRGERSDRGDYNRAVVSEARERRALTRSIETAEDEIVTQAPRAARSLVTVLGELAQLQADYLREHAALDVRRAELKSSPAIRRRDVVDDVMRPALRQQRAAEARLEFTQARLARVRSRRNALPHWITNPGRMIWAKHAELNALARARAELRSATALVRVRRQWLASPEGETFISRKLRPAIAAREAAGVERRTLERRMKRLAKRAGEVETTRLRGMIAQELGHRTIAAPTRTLGPTQLVRSLDQITLGLIRQHAPETQREAYRRVRQGLERGRSRDLPPIG